MILCNKKFYLLFFAFIFVINININISAAESRDIYVKLSRAASYSINAAVGNLMMTDAEGRIANLGDSTQISISSNNAVIAGHSFLMPIRITSEGMLTFNGKNYRGAFLITQRGGLLNVIDIEQYLCGVLPAEVSASWPPEALRAQAIISRTYALKQSLTRSDRGYDVVDTTMDQVYKGAGVETDKTNQAVTSTSGEILTYGKEIAHTYFHSDSGGHTANISDVWGQNVPYLTGVPEAVNYNSPVSTWSVKIPASKIQSAIAKVTGTDIGHITEIQVSEVDQGGRAVNMTFIGAKDTKTIKASQFRTAVDPKALKSTMLTPSGGAFKVENNLTPSGIVSAQNTKKSKAAQKTETTLTFDEEQGIAKMTSEGVFTSAELIDMLTNPNKLKNYYETGIARTGRKNSSSKSVKPVSKYGYSVEKSGSDFVFYGRGWGHGVGLSQWGCMAMANQGWKAEDILTHYYPGTAIKKFK